MAITAITLSDPARGMSYDLIPADGIYVGSLEVTATVREQAEDQASGDGTDDTTEFLGAGAVTLELIAADGYTQSLAAMLDAIAAFLLPWTRPYLVVTDDSWGSDRQVQLRFDSHAHPYVISTYREVQLGWKAPRGVWEDTAAQVWEIAADVPDDTGLVFTAANGATSTALHGWTFPVTSASGSAEITVNGSARPRWKAKLYGPCTGPKLSRDDTGEEIVFRNGLSIPAGDYVEIDSGARTARYLSQQDASRLSFLDYAQSVWPLPLDPGSNLLRYHASSGTAAGTVCELTVYPVWMP